MRDLKRPAKDNGPRPRPAEECNIGFLPESLVKQKLPWVTRLFLPARYIVEVSTLLRLSVGPNTQTSSRSLARHHRNQTLTSGLLGKVR